jgi:hypothetical protein
MSDWKALEQKLQSWAPRPPSAKIKATLFGPKSSEVELDLPAFRRWLVPSTALFAALLTFNFHTARPGFHWVNSPSTGFVAVVEFSQPQGAHYASLEHSDHNLVSTTSTAFEWTNGSHSLTTALPVLDKNSLIQ